MQLYDNSNCHITAYNYEGFQIWQVQVLLAVATNHACQNPQPQLVTAWFTSRQISTPALLPKLSSCKKKRQDIREDTIPLPLYLFSQFLLSASIVFARNGRYYHSQKGFSFSPHYYIHDPNEDDNEEMIETKFFIMFFII